jgi:L-ascorbate metabolism protein UlaG (beta-lactamase superfamily)
MKRRSRLRIFAAVLLVLSGGAIALLRSTRWLASLGGRVTGARLDRARRSPQFRDGKFQNAQPTRMLTGSYLEMARHQWFGRERREPAGVVPVVSRVTSDYATPPESGLRATWIGWSSVLVEIDGLIVLTDPVWSERCSPSTVVGPKRFHPPPISLDDLPHVDVAVISHDHYDHLDMLAVQHLAARGTHFAVPLGIGAHLERWGVPAAQIHELDWNGTFAFRDLAITATPARHYSGRNPLHGNDTLWTSWVVRGPHHRFFFSGDSGYSSAFAQIGAEHGRFDLTLIKIGAADPTWSEIHVNPEEAIRIHRDVRGRVMLPVHWCTFNLAFHAWRDPVERAVNAAAANGVQLVVPRPGELVEPSMLPARQDRWWANL